MTQSKGMTPEQRQQLHCIAIAAIQKELGEAIEEFGKKPLNTADMDRFLSDRDSLQWMEFHLQALGIKQVFFNQYQAFLGAERMRRLEEKTATPGE